MEPINMEDKKTIKKVDRIILDPETVAVLNDMIHQVQNELGELINVNTKVIANFILQKRLNPLSKDELNQLKNENHDIIKALKKATQEAIRSRQNGCELNYEDIQKILQAPKVIPANSDKTLPKKKKVSVVEFSSINNNYSDQNK
jgi:hypothetical protein